jgi:UDPglucose 6-dehydrogenase
VRKGIGSDSRIGPSFLFPGPGYGGSCFPKDVKALVRTGTEMGMELQILSAVDDVNARQKRKLGEKLREAIGENLRGMHIALWGLAFKPQTDDMRDAPSLTLIEDLLAAGATVCAHDPAAMKEARHRLGSRIQFADTNYDALNNADALVVITDWNEYRHPDFGRVKEALRKPVIVDGRNLYDPEKMREHGIRYYSMGRVVVEQPASARVGEYA